MQVTLELDGVDVKILCNALATEQLSMGDPSYFETSQHIYYNLCGILSTHIQESYMKTQKELEK